MDMLKELGIRRLEIFSNVNADGNIKVRFADLLEKETIYNEMLEALILMMDEAEKLIVSGIKGKPNPSLIAIIEKACYPKTWEEIKELLNA